LKKQDFQSARKIIKGSITTAGALGLLLTFNHNKVQASSISSNYKDRPASNIQKNKTTNLKSTSKTTEYSNIQFKKNSKGNLLGDKENISDQDGVSIKTDFSNGYTFVGDGTIELNVIVNKDAVISKGTKLVFKISQPEAIDWDNVQLNANEKYGKLSIDKDSHIIIFTFDVDVDKNADIHFIINLHTTNTDHNDVQIAATFDNKVLTINGGSKFNTKKRTDNGGSGGGIPYDNNRLILDNYPYRYPGIENNYIKKDSNSIGYYIPNDRSMIFNVILDPGYNANREKDYKGRVIELTVTGPGAKLSPDGIYITEQVGNYPNKSRKFVTLSQLGWVVEPINPQTVKIYIPDNISFGWGILAVVPYTPDLKGRYELSGKYYSDFMTNVQHSLNSAMGVFQNTNNKGFIPKLFASDKIYKIENKVTDLNAWLLEKDTANDLEDGNITSKITVKDDSELTSAIASNQTGTFPVTLSVTDSDGNTVTQTINVLVSKTSKTDLRVKDSILVAGPNAKWSAEDNFVSATNTDGTPLDFDQIEVTGRVDPTKVGKYNVTYSFVDQDGLKISRIATINVVSDQTGSGTKPSLPSLPIEPNDENSNNVNPLIGTDVTLMHNAYIYNEKGNRANGIILGIDSVLTTYGKLSINKRNFYIVIDKKDNKKYYVAVTNVEPVERKLDHNSYIYNQYGHRIKKYGTFKKGKIVKTYGSPVTIKGKKYYIIAKNRFVKALNFTLLNSVTSTVLVDSDVTEKTVMHNAYLYDENGTRANRLIVNVGSVVGVSGQRVINNRNYYELEDGLFIAAGNIDGTQLKLKHNSYVYNQYGERKGKKILKKGSTINTYGNPVIMKNRKFYIVGKNKFVKKSNF